MSIRGRRGASSISYALLIGLIAIVGLAGIARLGTGIGGLFTNVGNRLANTAGSGGTADAGGGGGGGGPALPAGVNFVRLTSQAGQRIQVSNDGLAWSPSGASEALTIDSSQMRWIGDRFSAAAPYASKVFFSSADGAAWAFNPQPGLATSGNLIDFGNNGARLVAVGGSTIVTSPDSGASWSNVTPGGLGYLSGVDYGNARWIAVGDAGAIWSSASGTGGWASLTSPVGSLIRRVRWQNGQFVAVGDGGMILTSPTGASGSFVSRASGTSAILWNVAYGNGRYVAVGGSGTVLFSTDNGVGWSPAATAMPAVFINHVVFASGRFRLVGEQQLAADSADGSTWTIRESTPGGHNYVNIASRLP